MRPSNIQTKTAIIKLSSAKNYNKGLVPYEHCGILQNPQKTSNHIQVFYVWLITSETIAQDSQYPLDPQGEIEDNNGYIEDHDDKKDNTD